MLTSELRNRGHKVNSFVEKAIKDEGRGLEFDVVKWIESNDGERKFEYDTRCATTANIVIYVGPSGTDAWAEVGAAWAKGVPILGLWAKGEPAGLMRRMVHWYSGYINLLTGVAEYGRRIHK